MKNRIIILAVVLLTTGSANAQTRDPKAKAVLDKFSTEMEALSGAEAMFRLSIQDLAEGTESIITGSFLMKGEKYKLVMDDGELYYNGTTVWNYMPEIEEVNIMTPADPAEEGSGFDNPVQFFRIIGSDFYYKYVEQGNNTQTIDLYPKDIKQDFTRIRMEINKQNRLLSATYFSKNRTQYVLNIEKFNEKTLDDSVFEFDQAKHPNVEIIDLR